MTRRLLLGTSGLMSFSQVDPGVVTRYFYFQVRAHLTPHVLRGVWENNVRRLITQINIKEIVARNVRCHVSAM